MLALRVFPLKLGEVIDDAKCARKNHSLYATPMYMYMYMYMPVNDSLCPTSSGHK